MKLSAFYFYLNTNYIFIKQLELITKAQSIPITAPIKMDPKKVNKKFKTAFLIYTFSSTFA